jgi:hypothetical protein
MPDFESYCRCPGCGTCGGHEKARKLKQQLSTARADALREAENAVWTLVNRAGTYTHARYLQALNEAIDAIRSLIPPQEK